MSRIGVNSADVGRRVRARRAADRRLVDVDDLVDLLDAGDLLVGAGKLLRAVELAGEGAVQDLVDERALPRARDAGDAGQLAEREGDRDVLEVVLDRAVHRDRLAASRAGASRARESSRARRGTPRQRARVRGDLRGRALRDDLAAQLPGPGPEVDDVVGREDRLLVVLDDDDGVPEIAHREQRVQQLAVVALVQADRRLVEDVQDAGQARADLRREADALPSPPESVAAPRSSVR